MAVKKEAKSVTKRKAVQKANKGSDPGMDYLTAEYVPPKAFNPALRCVKNMVTKRVQDIFVDIRTWDDVLKLIKALDSQ